MISVFATLEVLFRPEEEKEGNPVEVTDGDVSWGGALVGGIEGLDDVDWERPHSNLTSDRTPSGVPDESRVFPCGCVRGRWYPRMKIFDQWSGGIARPIDS